MLDFQASVFSDRTSGEIEAICFRRSLEESWLGKMKSPALWWDQLLQERCHFLEDFWHCTCGIFFLFIL
ncbi:MAG: hypothetical protein ACJAVK_000146 [Akkermansiaceae bacterium]|jgi:hypothetical protein